MHRSITVFYLFAILVLFVGCAKFAFRTTDSQKPSNRNWPLAGGSVDRVSHRSYSLALPLEQRHRFKMSSALGQNLVASNGILFAPTLDGRLAAINLTQMRIQVRKKLPQAYEATCAVVDTSLVIARRLGGKTLLHYNLRNGRQLWDLNAGEIASEPLIADSVIYCAALHNHVDAYHRSTGARLWQYRAPAQLRSSPALARGILVVGADNGTLLGLDARTGAKKWELSTGESSDEKNKTRPFAGGIQATPVISGQTVYVGTISEEFLAVDLSSGAVRWRLPVGSKVVHAAAASDSLVVFGANDGKVRAAKMGSGAVQWEFHASSVVSTSPTIAGSQIFFGSLDHTLYCLDLRDGTLLWQQSLEGRIRTNPIVWEDYLITACEDNLLYVFASPDSSRSF